MPHLRAFEHSNSSTTRTIEAPGSPDVTWTSRCKSFRDSVRQLALQIAVSLSCQAHSCGSGWRLWAGKVQGQGISISAWNRPPSCLHLHTGNLPLRPCTHQSCLRCATHTVGNRQDVETCWCKMSYHPGPKPFSKKARALVATLFCLCLLRLRGAEWQH